MGRMVRKQINMTEKLDKVLEEYAKELGVSQSEVVRLAVERFVEDSDFERRERAWKRLEEHWAEGERRGIGSGGKKWTREEIHERPGDVRRHKRSHLR